MKILKPQSEICLCALKSNGYAYKSNTKEQRFYITPKRTLDYARIEKYNDFFLIENLEIEKQ